MSEGAVVIGGAVARRAHYGGHVWALLHWVLGFRRLGWGVLFLDRLDPGPDVRSSDQVRTFLEVMRSFGLEGHASLDIGPDEPPVGLPRREVLRRVGDADLLLNIMGYIEDPEVLGRARHLSFLDIDPGFGQMWRALGQCDVFAGHHSFATVGRNIGRDGCSIPTCGLEWIEVLPPVDLDLWSPTEDRGTSFTDVGSWRGPWAPIEYEGETYGLRVHEFRRFLDVPGRTGLPFEVALEIDESDAPDRRRLRDAGWGLVDPRRVAGDPSSYRRWIRRSLGAFQIAKGMYVRSRSGWHSDRTACYLAAGRPAVVQDTGHGGAPGHGLGLVPFRGPEEAVTQVREVAADWDRHARAARELAREYFDAERVVSDFVHAVAA